MNTKFNSVLNRFFHLSIAFAAAAFLFINIQAATLSPALQSQLNGRANSASVGVVIVSFKSTNGLTLANPERWRSS